MCVRGCVHAGLISRMRRNRCCCYYSRYDSAGTSSTKTSQCTIRTAAATTIVLTLVPMWMIALLMLLPSQRLLSLEFERESLFLGALLLLAPFLGVELLLLFLLLLLLLLW